jgi:hypothetical protein
LFSPTNFSKTIPLLNKIDQFCLSKILFFSAPTQNNLLNFTRKSLSSIAPACGTGLKAKEDLTYLELPDGKDQNLTFFSRNIPHGKPRP